MGLKILTSQNATCPFLKNPLEDTSALAPSDDITELFINVSPVNGCNSGSTFTSVQISFKMSAVKFRISLCLLITKPTLAQDSACCTSKVAPQAQFMGKSG